jgi:Crinkler effector protein N-terminal domain
MSQMLELNCWVRGDVSTRIFPVRIGTGASVYDLKEMIKEKKNPEFNHLAADALDLWTVAIPIDKNLRYNLRKVDLVDEESLLPLELSEVFTDPPPRKHIHIIVQALRTGER